MSERYVADENFSLAIARMLRADGHDVLHVRDFMAGAADPDIVAEAHRRDAVLLTFDHDFGELTFRRRLTSVGIVLFRFGQQPPALLVSRVRAFLEAPPPLRGYFTVVTLRQVRQRPLLRVVDDED